MKAFKDLEIGDTIYILHYGYVVHEDDIDVVLKKIRSAKVTFVEEYHSAIRLSYHTSTYGRTMFVPMDNCIFSLSLKGDSYIATEPIVTIPNNTNEYALGILTNRRFKHYDCSRPQQIFLLNRYSIDYDKRKMVLAYMEYLYDENILYTLSENDTISFLKNDHCSITFRPLSANEFLITTFCLDDVYMDFDKEQKMIDEWNTEYPHYHHELWNDRLIVKYKVSTIGCTMKCSFDAAIMLVYRHIMNLRHKYRWGKCYISFSKK